MGSGRELKQDIHKLGRENFKREILFDFDNFTDMDNKEKELVKEFHTMLHGIDGNNVISDFSAQIDTNRQFQCGCNSMVECGVSIPIMGVQFSSSAPVFQVASIIVMVEWLICNQLVPVRPGVEAPVCFYIQIGLFNLS